MGFEDWSVVPGFGERRWDGKSRGGGFEKNVVMWFRRAVRALFRLVRICDWFWDVSVTFCADEVNYFVSSGIGRGEEH